MDSENRICQSCRGQFTIGPDDFGFYEQMKVPPPTWCPQCRLLRRMAWTGYRILYKRKCDFTGDSVITFYHPSESCKIYRQDIWWSDKWDPKGYGRDYDFSRPFFEQWKELFQDVPRASLHTDYATMVNSDYCNGAGNLKNCYLCFQSGGKGIMENCAYTGLVDALKDCLDIAFSEYCELSYEVVRTMRCARTFFSKNCEDCQEMYFSEDCVGCSNCIGCVNLRNKSYHIFNKPCTKEEFKAALQRFDFGSRTNVENFKKETSQFFLTVPKKAFRGIKNVEVSGDYVTHSKNVHDSYMVNEGENIRYAQFLKAPSANIYDNSIFGIHAEWVYDTAWVGLNVNTIRFGFWNYGAHDLDYSFGCHGSENLFGCVGLRQGSYCILNKQYTKEEYEALVPKIKKHMDEMPYIDKRGRIYKYGEFFPTEFSPWTYNESMASLGFIPLTKEQALAQGFNWRDEDKREYKDATMVIPDHIKDVSDDILKAILKCEECGKNYQIIPMELKFLRRFNLPIPRQCPLCRDRARIKQLNPMTIYDRTCAKCKKDIQTSYASDRPEIVYCESCYQKEVV